MGKEMGTTETGNSSNQPTGDQRAGRAARRRVQNLASLGRGISLTDSEADEVVRAAGGELAGDQRAGCAVWQPMETAPKDREILVRRHNDVAYEHFVVWWHDYGDGYPWISCCTAYPESRLDGWCDIPGGRVTAPPTAVKMTVA